MHSRHKYLSRTLLRRCIGRHLGTLRRLRIRRRLTLHQRHRLCLRAAAKLRIRFRCRHQSHILQHQGTAGPQVTIVRNSQCTIVCYPQCAFTSVCYADNPTAEIVATPALRRVSPRTSAPGSWPSASARTRRRAARVERAGCEGRGHLGCCVPSLVCARVAMGTTSAHGGRN